MEILGNISTTESPFVGALDAILTNGSVPIINAATISNLPVAGTAGNLFISTDTKALYRDNGSSWDIINSVGTSGIMSVSNGGTGGSDVPTAGKILLGNATGTYNAGTLSSASNDLSVSYASNTLTLSLNGQIPQHQSIATAVTTTVVTATNMFPGITSVASAIYMLELDATVQCSSTGGIKFSIVAPTGTTIEGWCYGTTTTVTSISNQRLTAINTLTATANNTVANTPAPLKIVVFIKTSTTVGTITTAFASVTAGQTSTLMIGSILKITRLS